MEKRLLKVTLNEITMKFQCPLYGLLEENLNLIKLGFSKKQINKTIKKIIRWLDE